jgi:hypothetical protein
MDINKTDNICMNCIDRRNQLTDTSVSLETILRASTRALVVGVGGGGDIVGALAIARFLQFCNLESVIGGLPWEQPHIDPQPGPRSLSEVMNVRRLHQYAWLANSQSQTLRGVRFSESIMADYLGSDVLLIDINGGVSGVIEGLVVAGRELRADLFVGVDVGGDSLATGSEPGLRSPLADSIMLAAFTDLQRAGYQTLWAISGCGSDGELTGDEIQTAISLLAQEGGFLGAWGMTQSVVSELKKIIQIIPTEASAIRVRCAKGETGYATVRGTPVKLTPLSAVSFFLSPANIFKTLSLPAQAVNGSRSIDHANQALHLLGLRTELDFERTYSS